MSLVKVTSGCAGLSAVALRAEVDACSALTDNPETPVTSNAATVTNAQPKYLRTAIENSPWIPNCKGSLPSAPGAQPTGIRAGILQSCRISRTAGFPSDKMSVFEGRRWRRKSRHVHPDLQ